MSDFVGYTRKPEPKWPYFVLFGAVIVILFFAFSMNSDIQEQSIQAKPTTATKKRKEEKAKIENPTLVISQEIKEKEKEKNKTNNSGIKVEEIIFTSKISDYHLPTDKLSSVSKSSEDMIYCYTKISAPIVPATIRHVWISPNGDVHADIKLSLLKQPGNLWSYVGTGEKQSGKWKVLVKESNGNVLAEKDILFKD